MRTVRTIAAALAGLVGLFLAIGLFLPSSRHVERSIVMDAAAEDLRPFVDGFARFNEWSPWAELDPDSRYVFSGPERGVGARMEWHSDKPDVGSGAQEIVAVADDRVDVALSFEGSEGSQARSYMAWQPVPAGLAVTWGFDMDFGWNPLYRWFGLMLEGPIGTEYEQGLAKLKPLVEQAARERAAAAEAAAATEAPAA